METTRTGRCVNHNENGTELRIGLIVLLFDPVRRDVSGAAKKFVSVQFQRSTVRVFQQKIRLAATD
jgi:hypothetical protein